MQYTVPSIVVKDLVPGSFVDRDTFNYTKRTINLGNACVAYILYLSPLYLCIGFLSRIAIVLLGAFCSIVEFVADARYIYAQEDHTEIEASHPQTFWVRA